MSEPEPASLPEDPAKTSSAGDTERQELTGRAGVVAAGTLLSRVLGLGREVELAAVFTTAATDAFFVAWAIPNVLRQLLAEGAVQTGLLPVLSQIREQQGEAEARRFFRAMRGLAWLVLLAVSAAGVLAAPWIVELWAAGYRDLPGQFALTVELTRWVFPYILLMGLAALGMAALNTYRKFVAASFAPALLNVAFIGAALLIPLITPLGFAPILAMAFGALLGGVLQVVAQWPSLKRIGYLERPSLELSNPGVRQALRRMAPVLVGFAIYYTDVLLSRRFLSELGVGPQSWFNFAMRLCDFPQGVFVMALQTATLPSLAALFARGERAELEKTLAYSLRLALFVGLPASVALVALAQPLVALMFERGQFGAEDTRQTAFALMALGLQVWMVAAIRQLLAVFYAMGDTRTPVLVQALDLAVFVALALLLMKPLGHVGICLATVGHRAVQIVTLLLFLRRRLEQLHLREVLGSAARSLLASLAAGVAGWGVAELLADTLPREGLLRMLPGLGGALIFGVAYFAGAALLRSPELNVVGGGLARRLRRRAR